LSRVAEVREWIGGIGRLVSLPESRVFDLQVVTSEAIANGIEHAASEVETVAWVLPDRLLVEVTNDGVFQPGLFKDDSGRRRGLGLPLMVSLADQVHVSRLPGAKTRVSLTFSLDGQMEPLSADPASEKRGFWVATLGWLLIPIPLLIVAAVVFWATGLSGVHDSQPLLTAFNTLFVSAACIAVAYFAAFSFLRMGSYAVLLLGTGSVVLAWGFVLAGPLLTEPNALVTVHNTSVMIAALLFAASGVLALADRTPDAPAARHGGVLLISYLAASGMMVLIAVLAVEQVLPRFMGGEGGYTLLRVSVLVVAVLAFALASFLYVLLYRRQASRFVLFASGAFAYFCVGLAVLLIFEPALGSPINWAARAGQWLGGVYLFAAVYALQRSASSVLSLERSLHEVEDRYQSLVNTSPDAILVHADGRYVFTNPSAVRMFAAGSAANIVGQDVTRLVHPGSTQVVSERIDQAYSGGMSPPTESRLLRLDGTAFDAELTRSLVRFEGKLAIQTVVRDISDRKRGESALRESEERYRALAEENERLYKEQLSIAETLQLALLNIPSQIGRVRLGHLYRSATEAARVGGDFYDVFEAKKGQIALLIGDVSGHGIDAARTATLITDVVHAFTHQSLRTNEVLQHTNELLVEKGMRGFVTLFLGILDGDTGLLRYCLAGHPEAVLRRAGGEVEKLGTHSTPLGVFPDAVWKPGEVEMRTGDVLVLYTDGITEARRNGEFFGEERLAQLAKREGVPVEELPQLILDEVLAFAQGTLRDDCAVLVLSRA
jgi:PAS domain S-box-containing protein